jgi:hypothetical protein
MSASSPADALPIDGAPFPFLREFIDANGGEAAFQGLTTDDGATASWAWRQHWRAEPSKSGW